MIWPIIQKGEVVDIIAPSGKIEPENIPMIQSLVENLGLTPRIPSDLLGDHPYSANTDEKRLEHLKKALYAPDSTLIWCVRGGYGTTRIVPDLLGLNKPEKQKLLVGFSDITSLHLWLNQAWHWPTLHGMMARQAACLAHNVNDFQALTNIWFNGLKEYRLQNLEPLNEAARVNTSISGITCGTNATLIQSSIGTPWQIDARHKIIFLEDINEVPYRLERLLVHLANAGIFNEARAIILGDFGENLAQETNRLLDFSLKNFSENYVTSRNIKIPIFRLTGFGHCVRNKPIPLGVHGQITDGGIFFSVNLES